MRTHPVRGSVGTYWDGPSRLPRKAAYVGVVVLTVFGSGMVRAEAGVRLGSATEQRSTECTSSNLVVNGSFDDGHSSGSEFLGTAVAPDSSSIPGWSVTQGSVDILGDQFWEPAPGSIVSLDMSGLEAGAIEQNISTVPGTVYKVQFALAGNPDGGADLKGLSVSAGEQTAGFFFFGDGTREDMGWLDDVFFFVAGASSTTVVFESLNDSSFGPALDNVVVCSIPPQFCNGLQATIVSVNGAVGGPGDDVIVGLPSRLFLGAGEFRGEGGNDTICAAAADAPDTLDGGPGDDYLNGGAGDDELFGGDGNDTLEGGPGSDFIDGEAGEDWAIYENAPSGVIVDLGAGTSSGGDGVDQLIRIRHLVGSAHNDKLAGNAFGNEILGLDGDDKIKGKKGDDRLLGGGGDDVIQGRQGDDEIDGEAGVDTASYFVAKSAVTVDLGAGTAFGDGADRLVGIENVSGSKEDDTLVGDAGINVLIGFKGGDFLDGGGGDDTLRGKPGDDTMFGGPGDDRLLGGAGTDTADGGSGDDFCRAEAQTAC